MLTKEQTDRVAAILNGMVDIPFLTEEMEKPIFRKRGKSYRRKHQRLAAGADQNDHGKISEHAG